MASREDQFEYREHRCSGRKAARVVAQKQQRVEAERDAAWIATKTPEGDWVARRVPVGSEEEPKTFWERVVGALLMFPLWPS